MPKYFKYIIRIINILASITVLKLISDTTRTPFQIELYMIIFLSIFSVICVFTGLQFQRNKKLGYFNHLHNFYFSGCGLFFGFCSKLVKTDQIDYSLCIDRNDYW